MRKGLFFLLLLIISLTLQVSAETTFFEGREFIIGELQSHDNGGADGDGVCVELIQAIGGLIIWITVLFIVIIVSIILSIMFGMNREQGSVDNSILGQGGGVKAILIIVAISVLLIVGIAVISAIMGC